MSRPKETIDSYMEAALFKLISQSIVRVGRKRPNSVGRKRPIVAA